MKNVIFFSAIIVLAGIMFAIQTVQTAQANHEMGLRKLGVGFNDYDNDGVTCAATDYNANLWSDRFWNHHMVNMYALVACENKERSYAGLPPDADNADHIDELNQQFNRMYGPGSGWAESFGD